MSHVVGVSDSVRRVECAFVERFAAKSCEWLMPGWPGLTIGSSLRVWLYLQKDLKLASAKPLAEAGDENTTASEAMAARRGTRRFTGVLRWGTDDAWMDGVWVTNPDRIVLRHP